MMTGVLGRSPARFARDVVLGVMEGVLLVLLYMYVVPRLFNSLYQELGANGIGVDFGEPTYVGVMASIVGLSIASRILGGTIFEPIFKSSANMIGILLVFYLMGDGIISVKNIPSGSFLMDVSIDLGPLLLVFFVFIALPGIVTPFIRFFLEQK